MKKNYKKLVVVAAVLFATSNVNAQGDPAIVLKNFVPADVSSGTLYQNAGNGITVKVVNGNTEALVGAASCLSINGDFTALTLSSGGYIDIINTGSFAISEVDYLGISASENGPSYPIAAVSLDGGTAPTFPDNLFQENVGLPQAIQKNVAKVLSFQKEPSGACSVTPFLIPETAYQGAIAADPKTPIANFDKQVKVVRFRWGTGIFAGQNPSSTTYAPNIFGIKIYLTDTSTGVEEVAAAEKTEVSSAYYDLSGRPVPNTIAKGFLIKKTKYDDGSIEHEKKYVK